MIRQLRTLTQSSVLLMISLQSWTVSGKTAFDWSACFEVLLNCCTTGQQKTLASAKAACYMITLKKNTVESQSLCTLMFRILPFFTVISTFLDWFWQIGVRPHGFPCLHSVAQITLSSLKVCVKLVAFVLYGMRLSFNHSMYFLLIKVYFTENKLLCFLGLWVFFYISIADIFWVPGTRQTFYVETGFWRS
jgi:hypothetical protein